MCTPIASTNASLQFNNTVFYHVTEKQKYNHADSNDKTSGIYIVYIFLYTNRMAFAAVRLSIL